MPTENNLLGTYLKDRRAKLDPVAFGLPSARRRTPGLGEAHGSDEAGDAGPQDGDPHCSSSKLIRSPTTYSGRCLTSS